MSEQLFVNRDRELEFLNRSFRSRRAEFLVLYGRRRVGKTELAKKFSEGKKGFYFFAEETLEEENLRSFRKSVSRLLDDPLVERSDLSWEELFDRIADSGRAFVVIDEFPNLIKGNRGLLSKFQKIWDERLADSKTKLILLGSSIGMMETHVLGYKSPLYGRRTGQIWLEPLDFVHLQEFFPDLSHHELMRVYGITDGIPAYINEVRFRLGAGEELEEVFRPYRMLFEEAEILVKSELREPSRYFHILKTVSFGYGKFGDIVTRTGLPTSTVSQYLHNLMELRFVSRAHPVTERKEKSRNARYAISDNYLSFYFRFIYPNKALLMEGEAIPEFTRDFNTYLGTVFEKAARQHVRRMYAPERLGRWWHKGEEIDLAAIKRGRLQLFEVKWSDLSAMKARKILKALEMKAAGAGFSGMKEQYGLVARQVEGKEKLRGEGYLVHTLDEFFDRPVKGKVRGKGRAVK
jgi:AAA+ ATPase superfamily predicted ATPase